MANLRTNNLSGEQGQNAYRGSVFFNGGSDSLVIPASSDFAYGTGDFTIEAWIWKDARPATGETRGIFTQTQSGNDYIVFKVGSTNNIQATFGSTTISTTGTLAVDSWNHVAVSRSSNTIKVFLNGIASSGSTVSTDFSDTTRNPTIGNYTHSYGSLPYYGYISNLRVTKGEALYTADFTPPTTELTADANTVLLCCQDSDDPLQEATGKTITGKGIHEYLNDTELVTNGSGLTTTGWTNAYTSTFTVEDGMIKVTRSGGSGYTAYQTITTVTGQQYTVSVNLQYGSGNYTDLRVLDGGTPESSSTMLTFLRSTSASTDGRKSTTITALSTSTTLVFTFDDGGDTGKFANISVKAANRGEQPRVIPPVGRDAGNAFGGPIQQSSQGYMYFPTGRTEERVIVNNNFGARGLIMGGITYPGTTYVNVIESIQIASLGNAVDFGDLTNKPNGGAGFSSKIRGFVVGGNTPEGYGINVIQFVTIATAGNASDFGDAGYSRANARGVSNNTRGVYSGGESASSPNPSLNNIEFITMSSVGNGQDFGDLVDAGSSFATASSPTRGVNMGGYRDGEVNFIDFITIATTGNSQDFGDLINTARNGNGGVSNGHRGIVMGGYSSPARTNVIQYVTIQSTGNAIDFGDLTDARDPAVTSSLTRGIACTGDYPSNVNIIDFIEIMTTANAVDFGDMLTKTSSAQTCSNAHGGLADDM